MSNLERLLDDLLGSQKYWAAATLGEPVDDINPTEALRELENLLNEPINWVEYEANKIYYYDDLMEILAMTATYYEGDVSMNSMDQIIGHPERSMHASTSDFGEQNSIGRSSPSWSSSPTKNDSIFEPTIDMMVNDFDDEQTLEEEEALAANESEDPTEELKNLQKESEMPIEELLALYKIPQGSKQDGDEEAMGCVDKSPTVAAPVPARISNLCEHESMVEEEDEQEEDDKDDDEIDDDDDEEEEKKEPSKLHELYPETYKKGTDKKRLLRVSRQSDDEDDDEYTLDEDECRKTIMVGSEFQAVIPDGLKKYDDVLPYENEDKLLWDPNRISDQDIETYLRYAQLSKRKNATGINAIPCGAHLRDDEQALYLLLQCGFNAEEALRRKRINSVPTTDQMTAWSEEECRNFESGIRVYGKDFYTIKQTKVKTRSVGEIVQFYYIWKKTERHDIFANKARLDKKKYSLHPGMTDFMDRFIDEQENNGNNISNQAGNNERSSSPSVAAASCSYLQEPETKRSKPKTFLPSTSGINLHNKKHSKKKCSILKANQTTLIPPDPLAIGDVEVFSGISKNYFNHKMSTKSVIMFPATENQFLAPNKDVTEGNQMSQ